MPFGGIRVDSTKVFGVYVEPDNHVRSNGKYGSTDMKHTEDASLETHL